MTLHLYGVRHHGPGCARAVLAALDASPPDVLLVEAPADAAALVPDLAHASLVPPFAWLLSTEAHGARYLPFAAWSPELVAMRWALSRGVPVQLMDLPAGVSALMDGDVDVPRDPIGELAVAAGWADAERFWEHLVETRRDTEGLWQGLEEAFSAVRGDALIPSDSREAAREAHMRRSIRAARRLFPTVAVVCGAWHVPALRAEVPAREDDARLKGLAKVSVAAWYVPWTHARLACGSYGAGMEAPAWYARLWAAEGQGAPLEAWMVDAARALRAEGYDVGSASVVEAVRLADELARLRGLREPSNRELDDAAVAALCRGDRVRWQRVARALWVGDAVGLVPEEVAQPPLLRELLNEAKRLRLPMEESQRTLELDLRQPRDLEKSVLLHRLDLLDVPWGRRVAGAGLGTFKEVFALAWTPQFADELAQAGVYGHRLDEAAAGRVAALAAETDEASALAAWIARVMCAALPDVLPALLDRLQAIGASSADPAALLAALPPLAELLRYGDVRGAPPPGLAAVFGGLLERALAALLPASASLAEDAAVALASELRATQAALLLLRDEGWLSAWTAALATLAAAPRHGWIVGTVCRARVELGALADEELEVALAAALSDPSDPAHGAAFVGGLLAGGAATLLPQAAVWSALDRWLGALRDDAFLEVLVPLRAAFADFSPAERAAMARQLARGGAPVGAASTDHPRADRVKPVLRLILSAHSA